jgi:predicted NUDIX family NTP pyrophosphohydrolase
MARPRCQVEWPFESGLADLPKYDGAKFCDVEGAEPKVIKGSRRALSKCSRAAQEIHRASIASVPRVCWNCVRARHFRWNTESVAGWNG